MKITRIQLNPDGDGYLMIFIDQTKFSEGDEYHDKIFHKYNAVIELLDFMKVKYDVEKLDMLVKVEDVEYYDLDFQPERDEPLGKFIKRMSKNFKFVKTT